MEFKEMLASLSPYEKATIAARLAQGAMSRMGAQDRMADLSNAIGDSYQAFTEIYYLLEQGFVPCRHPSMLELEKLRNQSS